MEMLSIQIVVFHSYVTNDQRRSASHASRPWPVVSARFGPFPGRQLVDR